MQQYITDPTILAERLMSLKLEITTVDAHDGDSDNTVYVNVVFDDGTRLYEPTNHSVGSPPDRGDKKRVVLPLPAGLERTLASVAEVFLRKDGSNGWF